MALHCFQTFNIHSTYSNPPKKLNHFVLVPNPPSEVHVTNASTALRWRRDVGIQLPYSKVHQFLGQTKLEA